LQLLGEAHHDLGIVYEYQHEFTKALHEYNAGLAFRQRLVKIAPSRSSQTDLGQSFGWLGDVQVAIGDFDAAAKSYKESQRIRAALVEGDASDQGARFELSRAYRNLGHVNDLQNRLREAAGWFEKAVEQEHQLIEESPTIRDYQREFAINATRLASLIFHTGGDVNRAQSLLDQAHAFAERLHANDPADKQSLSAYVSVLATKARVTVEQQPEQAVRYAATAHDVLDGAGELSADDKFEQALLNAVEANAFQKGESITPETGKTVAQYLQSAARSLSEAVQSSPHTTLPRIARERLFDGVALSKEARTQALGQIEHQVEQPQNRSVKLEERRSELAGLYALTVGVSDYAEDRLDLRFAAADADALAAVWEAQPTTSERKAKVLKLEDQSATRGAILNQLAELRRSITDTSLIVVSFSGHGTINNIGAYYFAPYDFDETRVVSATGVSWYDLQQEFMQIPGTIIVLLDTCHSGAAASATGRQPMSGVLQRNVDLATQQMLKAGVTNIVVLASALNLQQSQERSEWKHGALTLAILEALHQKRLFVKGEDPALPKVGPDGTITMEALRTYAVARVNHISDGEQRVIGNTVDLLGIRFHTVP